MNINTETEIRVIKIKVEEFVEKVKEKLKEYTGDTKLGEKFESKFTK